MFVVFFPHVWLMFLSLFATEGSRLVSPPVWHVPWWSGYRFKLLLQTHLSSVEPWQVLLRRCDCCALLSRKILVQSGVMNRPKFLHVSSPSAPGLRGDILVDSSVPVVTTKRLILLHSHATLSINIIACVYIFYTRHSNQRERAVSLTSLSVSSLQPIIWANHCLHLSWTQEETVTEQENLHPHSYQTVGHHPSIHQLNHPSTHPSIHPLIHPSTSSSTHPPIHHSSIHSSTQSFIHL